MACPCYVLSIGHMAQGQQQGGVIAQLLHGGNVGSSFGGGAQAGL